VRLRTPASFALLLAAMFVSAGPANGAGAHACYRSAQYAAVPTIGHSRSGSAR
jgi:hypothetical protein